MTKDSYSLAAIITAILESIQRSFYRDENYRIEIDWSKDQTMIKIARKHIEIAFNKTLNKSLKEYKVNNRYVIPADDTLKILSPAIQSLFKELALAGYIPGLMVGPLMREMLNRDSEYSSQIIKGGDGKVLLDLHDAQEPLLHALSTYFMAGRALGYPHTDGLYDYLTKSGFESGEIPRDIKLLGEQYAIKAARTFMDYLPIIHQAYYYLTILLFLAKLPEPPEHHKESWSIAQNVDFDEIQTHFEQIREAMEKIDDYFEPIAAQIRYEEYLQFDKNYNHCIDAPTE